MALTLKELRNQRMLSSCLRDASAQDIEEIITKIQGIYNEVKEREERMNARNAAKQAQVANLLQQMKDSDITMEDLQAATGTAAPARAKMKVRYRFTGVDGVERTWSGQGRLPNELKKLIERDGTTKEDYRIKEEAAE